MDFWYVWCRYPANGKIKEGFDGPITTEDEAQTLAMGMRGTIGHPIVVAYPTRDRDRAYGMFRNQYLREAIADPKVENPMASTLQRRTGIPEVKQYREEQKGQEEQQL